MNSHLFLGGFPGETTYGDISAEIFENEVHFSLELYKATAAVKTGFFAVSPMTVFFQLAALYFGAEGLSKEQLGMALNFSPDPYLDGMFQTQFYMKALEFSMFRAFGVPMNQQIFHAYGSNLEQLITEKYSSIQPPRRVTSWNELTSGLAVYEWAKNSGIKFPVIQKYEGDESLVLASAKSMETYHSFSARGMTNLENFYYNNNTRLQLPMTHAVAEADYGTIEYRRDSDGSVAVAKYLRLPLPQARDLRNRNRFSEKLKTFIILPSERDGIADLERSIDEATIRKILSNSTRNKISISLPQVIQIDSASNLVEPLKNMGLTEMFNELNDISNVAKTHPIKVGSVVNQVKLYHHMLDGESFCGRYSTDGTFDANHAFMILTVYHDKPNSFVILSMGRYGWISNVMDADTGIPV